ncbi:RRP12-like protein isoform X3 [Morus notabilis]|uniref:RRP12-like protein isoform X3 n=1 Tax=Morus notabilis TaxID=981085 RepID=UPI000CED591F|nr:RRP12-like protein isoform X3 [Morus notabilis]
MEDDKPEHDHDHEHEHSDSFNNGSDIFQQLMDRYSKSAAPQHRHLLGTAAAMRSLLAAESLPLTPPAYFAAVISAVDEAASSPQPLDLTAVAALLSFLAIVLPLAPPRGIDAAKASEAVKVLVRLLEREKEGLAVATVRAGVKCLGVLVGFCDLEDWNSVKLGFETLIKFSVDRRPKVRRCSQECLEKVFKSITCSAVTKEASKLVMSMLKTYMPLAGELGKSGALAGSKDDILSEPKNVEVFHMLNMLKLIVPFLSMKTRSKVLSEVDKIMKSQFSAFTRHILKTIETCFETSSVDAIAPKTEKIVVSLSSYVSLGDKNPLDTVISATTLLKRSLDILRAGESSAHVKNLPLVFDSIAGLLTSEASIASHAATILKELISHHLDQRSLPVDDNQPLEVEGEENIGASAIQSACAILENSLMTSDGKPNEYILGVISALFLKLGRISYYYMRNILLKLADLMSLASKAKSKTYHLENCIGAAVFSMGPEKLLMRVPITLNAGDFTCANIWLVPILTKYVVGASLGYYMEHIMPLAKSFQRASRKDKRATRGQNLQDHARDLRGLLPAFCRYPTDLYQNFQLLGDVLIKFLKEDSSMHENVAISLQVLVNQNKRALTQKTDAGGSNSSEVKESIKEFGNLPTYSKKIASKNIKALSSYSTALLQALAGLYIESPPGKRSILKDAVGCLVSITDSSITKEILISFFEHFKFIDDEGEFVNPENGKALIDKDEGHPSTLVKDAERCSIMELASSLVGGAKADLVDLIYKFVKYSFQVTDGIGDQQTYHTLSRILQEHAWFCSSQFVELIDSLLDFKSPTDVPTLRSRFACFHPLMVHLLKIDSEEENAKAFQIVNEIILTLKDAKEEARKAAYDVLLDISSSLRDVSSSSSESSEAPYQKLITMIMGYLSGASPHIKSGAVSVLSVLIYKDANIHLSMPDLVPSLLPLLQGKSLEVIKAVLGFMKVLASSLPARDLQNLLSCVVKGILPWSAFSRNHFRSKVTVIMEIMIRKCGLSAVELVTPERYRSFVKSVVENRHNKTNSKDAADSNTEAKQDETFTSRHRNRKRKELDTAHEKTGSVKNEKGKKKHIANSTGTKESDISTAAAKVRRFSKIESSYTPGRGRKSNKKNFDKGPWGGQKRKINMSSKDKADQKPASRSTLARQ